jgi:clan AA aspartic protease
MFFQSEFIYSINSRKLYFMGQIHAEIELINGCDLTQVHIGDIDPDQVRRIRVSALVDTGSFYMTINENIQEYLRLPVVDHMPAQLADGKIIQCKLVGPLEVRFENRRTVCDALVLPGDSEPLLGAFPIEGMDILIDSRRQELIVNPQHPHHAMVRL